MKRSGVLVLLVGLWLGAALPAGAKDKEGEKIDAVVTAVIEAYRKGDYATMGRSYAPEVTVVAGDFTPPVAGWATVEERYRAQHANLGAVELSRENTRIERRGKTAWAIYQWRFAGILAGTPVAALGHTTLILEKRGGQWIIVHNHTSAIPAPPPAPTPTEPAKPPAR